MTNTKTLSYSSCELFFNLWLAVHESSLPEKALEGCGEEGAEEALAVMIGWLFGKGRPALRQNTKKLSLLFCGPFSIVPSSDGFSSLAANDLTQPEKALKVRRSYLIPKRNTEKKLSFL